MPERYRPKVVKETNGSLRISNIRSDTDLSSSLAIVVSVGGDVGISITDPKKGMVGIDLAPHVGGGKNPEISSKFRDFARELVDLIIELDKK